MKSLPQKPTVIIFDMDGTTVRHVNPAFLSALEFLDNSIEIIEPVPQQIISPG